MTKILKNLFFPFLSLWLASYLWLYQYCEDINGFNYGFYCSASIADSTGVSEVHSTGVKVYDQNGNELQMGPVTEIDAGNGIIYRTATVTLPTMIPIR